MIKSKFLLIIGFLSSVIITSLTVICLYYINLEKNLDINIKLITFNNYEREREEALQKKILSEQQKKVQQLEDARQEQLKKEEADFISSGNLCLEESKYSDKAKCLETIKNAYFNKGFLYNFYDREDVKKFTNSFCGSKDYFIDYIDNIHSFKILVPFHYTLDKLHTDAETILNLEGSYLCDDGDIFIYVNEEFLDPDQIESKCYGNDAGPFPTEKCFAKTKKLPELINRHEAYAVFREPLPIGYGCEEYVISDNERYFTIKFCGDEVRNWSYNQPDTILKSFTIL